MANRFFALLPVRDESDIVGQCITAIAEWADAIYVLDTGSLDQTWEIVQERALTDKRIVPMRKEAVYFSETRLRGHMFDVSREQMRDGDWFLRVDADEFHHISPPEFVRNCMQKHETVAYHQYYDFRLLQSEVDAWECGKETLADRARPIAERRRHYTISTYAEPRLCRYRSAMKWPETVSFPFNAGFVANERLPIRHYPHRDPEQLKRRCRLRAVMMADETNRKNWSEPELHHWTETEWEKFVTPDNFPGLKHWTLGTELPFVHQSNHLKAPPVRLLQRLIHATALPLLDRARPGFSADARPQPIPPKIIQQLERELGC